MSLCHIYNKTSSSQHRDKLVAAFSGSKSIDISNATVLDDFSIYVIELEDVSKRLSLKIKEIFESKIYPLIYFIVPKEHSLMLFQLAFLINTKTLITLNQDTTKIISKLKADLTLHEHEYQEINLGKTLINTHLFMHFKNDRLQFASKALLDEFSSEGISDIENSVCSKIDMMELLSSGESGSKELVSNKLKENKTFHIKSIANRNENLISLETQSSEPIPCMEENYISSRINFVEFLKDRLLEKMISEKSYSILTISINDLKNVAEGMDESEKEYFRKEFIYEVELILDNKIMLAQYDADMYIAVFEDIEFSKLELKAQSFHIQMSRFINKQKFNPTVSLYALKIETVQLTTLLKIFDNIARKKLTKVQRADKNLKYINNIQESMSENEIISFLLDSAFVNNTEFKLLNVHKGIFINTSSAILKKDNDSIYVKVEQLQGAVMSIEKKTVIQSSAFTRDIQATVKYINVREKIAILENFKILDINTNLRKHGRVNCLMTTIVAISLVGSRVKGEIIDISANSLAIKIKSTRALNNITNKEVGLSFYLPSYETNSGQYKLDETATVVYQELMDDGYLKLICVFNENKTNEEFLVDYVYSRQRSIIKDMRNMLR